MSVLAIHLTQSKYGTADAIAAITVAGVARPDVTVKPTRTQAPHVERIEGAWLPGSTVAVALSLKNDKFDAKGDRNVHVLRVELDGIDQGITRDVLGAAVIRFDVKVPAAPLPLGLSAPGAAEVAVLTGKVDALLMQFAEVTALLRESMERQAKADRAAAAFYAAVEFVPEGEVVG